jgi:excisionase family DNA binding protein
MLHIGRDKVYYLLRTGQLRSLKIGKLRRITEQQLGEFIASLDDARVTRDVLGLLDVRMETRSRAKREEHR